MEKISYLGQPNCLRLSDGTVEVVVTTDVGPRVVRYGFIGEDNILGELPEVTIPTELGDWKPWGGHRLWAAPEAMPRSYAPDNDPVSYETEGDRSIRLMQEVEPQTRLQKEITVTLDEDGVRLRHKVTNRNLWAIDAAPWALTVMNGGGTVILPQEPYLSHDDYLHPARPLVLWHFTDLSDPRWIIGKKYIRLHTEEAGEEPQKIGIMNKQRWAAYHHRGTLFVKYFDYQEGATYPDYGCNNEVYSAGSFVEVESLAPLSHLEPGASAEHVERWRLFRNVRIDTDEESLDAAVGALMPGK